MTRGYEKPLMNEALRTENYVELYSELADTILREVHSDKIQIERKYDNGDIGYTDEAQELFNKYCNLVEEVLTRSYPYWRRVWMGVNDD